MTTETLDRPKLNEGETLIGLLSDKDMRPYWLILLPGDNDRAPHQQQIEWAKSIGGDLPNRVEATMLFARAKEQFQQTWYWTSDTFVYPYEPEYASDYVWVLSFRHGSHDDFHKSDSYKARAVRRVYLENL